MKRSKGFILTDILTGMLVQSLLILSLCGAFYMLLSFGTSTQQVLTARERGRRVISYVDQRIRNAGLGLWKYHKSSTLRESLRELTKIDSKPLENLMLPVAVTYFDKHTAFDDNDKLNKKLQDAAKSTNIKYKDTDKNIIYGNVLTLLYAQRHNPKNKDLNLVIVSTNLSENASTDVNKIDNDNYERISDDHGYEPIFNSIFGKNLYTSVTEEEKKFRFIDYSTNHYNDTEFANKTSYNESKDDEYIKNIKNWTVLAETGIPLYIAPSKITSSVYGVKLKVPNNFLNETGDIDKYVKVHAGDELLYLKCDRVCVINDMNAARSNERNFVVQNLASTWSNAYYHETGILEVYFELDTTTKILDMSVLASGGRDNQPDRHPNPPANWGGYWNEDYANHVLYVSRASWRLNNLAEDFTWD